jgi:hypothetical protein
MRTSSRLLALTAILMTWILTAFDTEAASNRRRKVDPNAVDTVPSPFRGVVVNVTPATLLVRGEVTTRDPSGGKGRKVKEDRSVSFSIKADTRITRNGKPAELKDVQKDEFVSVTFTTKKGSSLKHVTEVAVGKEAADVQGKSSKSRKKKNK